MGVENGDSPGEGIILREGRQCPLTGMSKRSFPKEGAGQKLNYQKGIKKYTRE